MTSSKLKKIDQHTHDMTQIEGGHVDDRVGAVPGPDSVNRRVSGPGTELGSVPGLARLKLAICKRGSRKRKYGKHSNPGSLDCESDILALSYRGAAAHTRRFDKFRKIIIISSS